MITPLILSLAFLGQLIIAGSSNYFPFKVSNLLLLIALWLATSGIAYRDLGQLSNAFWKDAVIRASLAISLTLYTLVTGLIVFKIFRVYQNTMPLYDQNRAFSGRSKLLPVIFVLIESDMAMFVIELIRLVVSTGKIYDRDPRPLGIIGGINRMLIVIIKISYCYLLLLLI